MEILDIQALSFEYPDGKRALEDISFSLFPGEFALMCGSSGCGKTTLMRLLKREPHAFVQAIPAGGRYAHEHCCFS